MTVVECAEYDYIDIDARLWLSEGHETKFNSEIDGRDISGQLQEGCAPAPGNVVRRGDPAERSRRREGQAPRPDREPDANGHRDWAQRLPLCTFRQYSGRGTADDWAIDIYADALLEHVDHDPRLRFASRV